jgi:glycosyltransferase involved in cell wall biosynthesis
MRIIGNSLPSANDVSDEILPTNLASLLPEPGREVLTAVVRLNPEKNLAMVVEAAARLAARGRPVVVLLVGDGVEADRLRGLADGLGVERIMPGPVYSAPELALIYERTSVTVLPTFAGLTAIQSIQFGRPVVTCDNIYRQMPESACVIPGRTGGLFADGSLEALEATIEDWLDRMKLDAEQIAKECRDEAEANWSPNAQANFVTSAIAELFAGRKHHQ